MMASYEIKGLDEFEKALTEIIENKKADRADLHGKIAEALKQGIDSAIGKSGLNDASGHIKSYQQAVVGSRGGYAALRPIKGSNGKVAFGALTQFLEGGHKIRQPGTAAKRYRPRINTLYVSGFHFYGALRSEIEGRIIALAEAEAERIAKELEG